MNCLELFFRGTSCTKITLLFMRREKERDDYDSFGRHAS